MDYKSFRLFCGGFWWKESFRKIFKKMINGLQLCTQGSISTVKRRILRHIKGTEKDIKALRYSLQLERAECPDYHCWRCKHITLAPYSSWPRSGKSDRGRGVTSREQKGGKLRQLMNGLWVGRRVWRLTSGPQPPCRSLKICSSVLMNGFWLRSCSCFSCVSEKDNKTAGSEADLNMIRPKCGYSTSVRQVWHARIPARQEYHFIVAVSISQAKTEKLQIKGYGVNFTSSTCICNLSCCFF